MKQNFKSLNRTLQNIIQKYKLDESYADQTIKNDWIKIVNKNIYKIVKPIKIEKHVLYLHVNSEFWNNELDKVKVQIIEMVNKYLDPYRIREISYI